MIKIYSETDENVCRRLWEEVISPEQITDLWEVRECFHRNFKRKLFFVVAKQAEEVVGLIPLCFIEEHGYYGYFPGEVWHGKTWLELNRVITRDHAVLQQMLDWLCANKVPCHLRYLSPPLHSSPDQITEDEIGYLFYPEPLHFSMEEYYAQFSKKTLKKVRREVKRFYDRGLVVRLDDVNDFEEMVTLNMDRFGSESYFADESFVESFRALRDFLISKGWLKMTTMIMDGQIAAVDMGCVYNGNYKLLAGGTNADFAGIAKVINLHHMQEACKSRYHEADFLCGDFSWKTMFHLTPRPLYQVSCCLPEAFSRATSF